MSITAIRTVIDPNDVVAEDVITYHVLGTLRRDFREWFGHVRNHERDGFSVPRNKSPHMHPANSAVPCMFCCAYSGEISTVSAAIILTLAERKLRDDEWNADVERTSRQVFLAAKSVPTDDMALEKVFGPHWVMVLALAYRVEYADARSVVDILTQYKHSNMGVFTTSTLSSNGPDWTLPARWLVSIAMSKKPSNIPARRAAHRDTVSRLASLASVIATDGNPDNGVAEWVPLPVDAAPLDSSRPQLRVVVG